jgi:hypothetical protein
LLSCPGDQFRCYSPAIPLQGSENSAAIGAGEIAFNLLIYNDSSRPEGMLFSGWKAFSSVFQGKSDFEADLCGDVRQAKRSSH